MISLLIIWSSESFHARIFEVKILDNSKFDWILESFCQICVWYDISVTKWNVDIRKWTIRKFLINFCVNCGHCFLAITWLYVIVSLGQSIFSKGTFIEIRYNFINNFIIRIELNVLLYYWVSQLLPSQRQCTSPYSIGLFSNKVIIWIFQKCFLISQPRYLLVLSIALWRNYQYY